MPGVQIMNSPTPAWLEKTDEVKAEIKPGQRQERSAQRRKDSLQQWVTDATVEWIDSQGPDVYELRSEQINKAMIRRKPELAEKRKTLQRGVNAAKELLAKRTENRWRMASNRTWVRAG